MNLLGLEAIVDAACVQVGITVPQLVGNSRHRDFVLAREIACVLLRDVKPGVILATQPSLPEIATALHRQTHSGVYEACQRGRLNPLVHKHARQVCDRLAIPCSHWPAWMVGSTQEVSHACS